jgi:hypothetical protein
MNIAAMARKFLALLLIMISWFSVAGFDILEDPNRSEFYSSRRSFEASLFSFYKAARGAATDWFYGTLAKAKQGSQLHRASFEYWNCALTDF